MSALDDEVVVKLPDGSLTSTVAKKVDNLVARIARHWLFGFNVVVGLFIALPFLAPVLMHLGASGVARVIYVAYSPTCHQLPERSFFLYGPSHTYTVEQLDAAGVLPAGSTIFQRELLRFNGSEAIGYKVAVCERDVAIYGAILLCGLVFGWLRATRWRSSRAIPKLPFWAFGLLLGPIAIDGLTQLVGWRESDWILRSITGALFGMALVALAYPYVEEAMRDILVTSRTPAEDTKNQGA